MLINWSSTHWYIDLVIHQHFSAYQNYRHLLSYMYYHIKQKNKSRCFQRSIWENISLTVYYMVVSKQKRVQNISLWIKSLHNSGFWNCKFMKRKWRIWVWTKNESYLVQIIYSWIPLHLVYYQHKYGIIFFIQNNIVLPILTLLIKFNVGFLLFFFLWTKMY